jgi:hypothetical protein
MIYYDTGGRYDQATDIWSPTSVIDAPSGRFSHTATWIGNAMVVWGGTNSQLLDSGGRYDPLTDTWSPTSTVEAPTKRTGHTSVWTGSLMIIWGGHTGNYVNSGGLYAFGHSNDDDGDGLSECDGDCSDANDSIYPGAPEVCDGVNNDCNDPLWPSLPPSEADSDGDGVPQCDDCNDADGNTYPGAPETNDGIDNQCPGDMGHGVIDEISGICGFQNPNDKTEFSWSAQEGATSYEVVRSSLPNLSGDCMTVTRTETYWGDAEDPAKGVCYHYLVRALTPHVGSWGQDSAGVERTNVCP